MRCHPPSSGYEIRQTPYYDETAGLTYFVSDSKLPIRQNTGFYHSSNLQGISFCAHVSIQFVNGITQMSTVNAPICQNHIEDLQI